MKQKLNIDPWKSIADFQALTKSIDFKTKMYKLIFMGKGPEFDGFRSYEAFDDASNIDWKASVRSNKLLVKKYKEERRLKFVFIIDVSDGMVLGSTEKLKCEYAGDIISALSNLILDIGDQIGFILYNTKVIKFSLPSTKRENFFKLIDSISDPEIYTGGANLRSALEFLEKNLGKSADGVILVSDFSNVTKTLLNRLSFVGNNYETFAVIIKDPLDDTLPDINTEVVLEDPATGRHIIVNPKIAKKQYEQYSLAHKKMVEDIFDQARIDFIELNTSVPFTVPLVEFLEERTKKRSFI